MFQQNSFYLQVDLTNPKTASPFFPRSSSSSSSIYPTVETENLIAEEPNTTQAMENVLVTIPGAILHLTGKDSSMHLASGDLTITNLGEGNKVVVVLAHVRDEVQWSLAKDVAVVKLDQTHYFFTLQVPHKQAENGFKVLNYGLTMAEKGQEKVLKELDRVMAKYSFLSKEKV
ncbi:protein EARLY-RESPONSIVE TO DEHYDRATION 7, chloroplastic-like [Vigna radiata var. radiata]|uniref:Protein EARLY-RESPONSIVE TO DEHYDRATION 7, chloroplastic-like n=1 Tax=Vigna radiata var. radiata TaxID=3916 RepID=A0A1S3VN56_VIGRR|nr:protein EARLY-RESPONSIVE TO DEHYDRATION 7, chloroplastic-like [Vigna radiata var. radiata]